MGAKLVVKMVFADASERELRLDEALQLVNESKPEAAK
jgi:hypothetical protein